MRLKLLYNIYDTILIGALTLKKIDKTIIKETIYISAWVLILSLLMQAVFLIIDIAMPNKEIWNYTVILGNLLSAVCGILNFFFLGLTVQRAMESDDDKYKRNLMRLSKSLRMLFVFCVIVLGAVFRETVFNLWATLIPLFFPRIAIAFHPFFNKRGKNPVATPITSESDTEGGNDIEQD